MVDEAGLPYELWGPLGLRSRDTGRNEFVLDRQFIISLHDFEQAVEFGAIIDRKVRLGSLQMSANREG